MTEHRGGRRKEPTELKIANTLGEDVFMRIRSGEKDSPDIQVMRPLDLEYPIKGNDETFLFPKNSILTLNLKLLEYPLRLRVWSTDYQPTPDVDQEGLPIPTSKENIKNSKVAVILPKSQVYTYPLLALYRSVEKSKEGVVWDFRIMSEDELKELEQAQYLGYIAVPMEYITLESKSPNNER